MYERTASEQHEAVAAWRETAPANDHQIFGRSLKTDKPKHRDLSGLSALLAMYSRPSGVAKDVAAVEAPAPIQTTWSRAHDNHAGDMSPELALEIQPTIDRIIREIEELPVVYRT